MKTWRKTLFILWLGQVLSLMSFGFGIPFLPFYIRQLGVTDPTQVKLFTGILNVAPAITMAITAPIWGSLADKYGRKLMILRAMFSASVLIGLMGLSQNVYMLLFLRILQGVFTGTVAASQSFVAANAPKKELAFSLGFMSSAQFLGYSIGPALGGFTGDYFGFRTSFFIGASIMLIGAIFTLVFLKEDKRTFGSSNESGEKTIKHGFKFFFNIVGIILFCIMLQRFLRSIFVPFMPLYLEEIHGKNNISTLTGVVEMFVSLATAIAGLTLTRLADKMNKNKLITYLLSISFVFIVVLRLIPNSFIAFLIIYTVLFFFLGGIEPIMTSLSAERVNPKYRGSLFGIQAMLGSIGWMLAPMIGSYVSIHISYKALFTLMAIVIAINIGLNYIDTKDSHIAYDNIQVPPID